MCDPNGNKAGEIKPTKIVFPFCNLIFLVIELLYAIMSPLFTQNLYSQNSQIILQNQTQKQNIYIYIRGYILLSFITLFQGYIRVKRQQQLQLNC